MYSAHMESMGRIAIHSQNPRGQLRMFEAADLDHMASLLQNNPAMYFDEERQRRTVEAGVTIPGDAE